MLKALERKMELTRREVEECVDFYVKSGIWVDSDYVLSVIYSTKAVCIDNE